MLKARTEEQRLRVEELLAPHRVFISWPLGFESDGGERVDSVYIDGEVCFDTLAEIVDYLRSCNPSKM